MKVPTIYSFWGLTELKSYLIVKNFSDIRKFSNQKLSGDFGKPCIAILVPINLRSFPLSPTKPTRGKRFFPSPRRRRQTKKNRLIAGYVPIALFASPACRVPRTRQLSEAKRAMGTTIILAVSSFFV